MKKYLKITYVIGLIAIILLIGYSFERVGLAQSTLPIQMATQTHASEIALTQLASPGIDPQLSLSTSRPTPILTATALPVEETTVVSHLPAEMWESWPILPQSVSDSLREVYRRGMANGNSSTAFSVLGDCQSEPDVFMGVYDRDPAAVQSLPANLQETVAQFQGSFDRYSPTVKGGTTEGALLWTMWNENLEGKCTAIETPLDCELRVQRPSIAFVHVGTHWETRNEHYLTIIIEKLLENGTVPIIVTKADNLELDERVNNNLARLAEKYDLPMWNFWASVQDLPRHGFAKDTEMLLSKQAKEIHRLGALQTLDFVWRALQEKNHETH